MAEQTMIRVSKEARDLAEALATASLAAHAKDLPANIVLSSSQGSIIFTALQEYRDNHPELKLSTPNVK